MQKLFNKILVPIDFSIASKQLLEKAVDIAKDYDCSIHLLHVIPMHTGISLMIGSGGIVSSGIVETGYEQAVSELQKLCARIPFIQKNNFNPGFSVVSGSWDDAIIELVINDGFDLVLLSQPQRLFGKGSLRINADKVALRTNVPVMTVPINRRLTKLYSIVVPVTDFLPLRKLIYGIYVAEQHNTTLKLLGIENVKTESKVNYYLQKAYCLVREHCNVRVELEMILSDNIAEGVNAFARLNAADLIIVNPVSQTKSSGFFAQFFGKILHRYAVPPVLTINQISY